VRKCFLTGNVSLIFCRNCEVESLLLLPTKEQVGPTRLPNLAYPSDHIALACDFKLT